MFPFLLIQSLRMSTNDFSLEFNANYNILYENNMLIWKIISTQSFSFLLIIIGHIRAWGSL